MLCFSFASFAFTPPFLVICLILGELCCPFCSFLGPLFLLRSVRFWFGWLPLRLFFFCLLAFLRPSPLCCFFLFAATLTHRAGPDRRRTPAGCSRPPLAQVARGSPSGQASTATGHDRLSLSATSTGTMPQGHYASTVVQKASPVGTALYVSPLFSPFLLRVSQYSVGVFLGLLGVWSGLVLPFPLRAVGIYRSKTSLPMEHDLLRSLPLLLLLLPLLKKKR